MCITVGGVCGPATPVAVDPMANVAMPISARARYAVRRPTNVSPPRKSSRHRIRGAWPYYGLLRSMDEWMGWAILDSSEPRPSGCRRRDTLVRDAAGDELEPRERGGVR